MKEKIIEIYVKNRNLRENYVNQQTYIMAVEYAKKEKNYRTKIIVTDSENQNTNFFNGNNIYIITSKSNRGISILNYGKYKPINNSKKNKSMEKHIDDIVNEKK